VKSALYGQSEAYVFEPDWEVGAFFFSYFAKTLIICGMRERTKGAGRFSKQVFYLAHSLLSFVLFCFSLCLLALYVTIARIFRNA